MEKRVPIYKREFARRAETGEFGNQALSWPDPVALMTSSYYGPVAIRYRGAPNGPCIYDIPFDFVWDHWNKLVAAGWESSRLFINEQMPDDSIVFQGEVRRPLEKMQPGYEIHYSTMGRPMREALRHEPKWADGVRASMLLRHFLDPSSFDDLEELLTRYPDAIVELSTYSHRVGILRRPTVFWEVRNY